jgi:hypothetical protein
MRNYNVFEEYRVNFIIFLGVLYEVHIRKQEMEHSQEKLYGTLSAVFVCLPQSVDFVTLTIHGEGCIIM